MKRGYSLWRAVLWEAIDGWILVPLEVRRERNLTASSADQLTGGDVDVTLVTTGPEELFPLPSRQEIQQAGIGSGHHDAALVELGRGITDRPAAAVARTGGRCSFARSRHPVEIVITRHVELSPLPRLLGFDVVEQAVHFHAHLVGQRPSGAVVGAARDAAFGRRRHWIGLASMTLVTRVSRFISSASGR